MDTFKQHVRDAFSIGGSAAMRDYVDAVNRKTGVSMRLELTQYTQASPREESMKFGDYGTVRIVSPNQQGMSVRTDIQI